MPAIRKVYGIVPPTGKFIREDRCQTPIKNMKTIALRPPIDLMYVTAAFEQAGCECRIKDYPGEEQALPELEADLAEFQPDLVLMSITTPSLNEDLHIAEVVKKVLPDALVAAKGAHFNTLDVDSLEKFPQLDFVLRGEYEGICIDLAKGSELADTSGITWRTPEGEIKKNPDRVFEQELDAFPYPARHLTNNELYRRPDNGELQTTLVTNRGCPFHCIYCLANQVAGVKNRYRSVENVIGEIRECVEKHGIRNFLFRSDLFTQNKAWVIKLCKAIIDEGLDIEWACNSRVDTINDEALGWMKKAGCWIIAFGVESGDQEVLDRLDKKAKVEQAVEAIGLCRKHGIKSSAYLLIGLPWDTEETIAAQMKYARVLNPDVLEYFYTYPFPGTPLHKLCLEEGLIKEGEIIREAYDQPAMPGLYLSEVQFAKLRRRAMRDFYLRPSKVVQTLAMARNPKELMNYIRVGVLQLRDLVSGG